MKHLLLTSILALTVLISTAQKDAMYIRAGGTVARNIMRWNTEVGVRFKKNELGFNFQWYKPEKSYTNLPQDFLDSLPRVVRAFYERRAAKEYKTQLWGSIGYTRIIPIVKHISFRPNAGIGLNISGSKIDPRAGGWLGGGFGYEIGNFMFATQANIAALKKKDGEIKTGFIQYGGYVAYFFVGKSKKKS